MNTIKHRVEAIENKQVVARKEEVEKKSGTEGKRYKLVAAK